MALRQLLFLAISMTLMVGPQIVEAQQRQHQGPRQGPLPLPDDDLPIPGEPSRPPQQGPRPQPAPRPLPPSRPAPVQPPPPQYPGNGNGGYNGSEQKTIFVQRRVINERFNLFALAGINLQRYQGCIVDSVVVDVRGSDIRTQMGFIINGNVDQWANAPQSWVQFNPRFQAVIGQVRMMEVEVRGMSDIATIALNIRCQGNGGGGGGVEQPGGFPVNLGINRRLIGNDRLDLAPYFNVQQYRGYRLVSVQFEAVSLMNVSFMDFTINNNFVARAQVGPWNQTYTINAQNAILGQNAESLVFYTQGQLDVRNVILYLEKCDHGQPPPPPRPR